MHSTLSVYAELHCLSNFSFLRGASHPEKLVKRAADLGYSALDLTDECSFVGVVRVLARRALPRRRLDRSRTVVRAERPCPARRAAMLDGVELK